MPNAKKEKIDYAHILNEDFKKHNLSYTCKPQGIETIFTLSIPANNAPGMTVKLIVDEDGDCKLRSYLARNVPPAKWPAIYSVLNNLNATYRYICLSVDNNGVICASYDFALFVDAESVFAQRLPWYQHLPNAHWLGLFRNRTYTPPPSYVALGVGR